ncbi:MAG: VOC family protein [Acidimicrobiia bacterium]|nr:VOC family protein [Acidimicrobiia bacterium]
MQLQTVVYVSDMDRSIAFYEHLGFEVDYRGGPVWTAFKGADGILALHTVEELPGPGRVALGLLADRSLEQIIETMAQHGIETTAIESQSFGRSVTVRDPDGLAIQVNEHTA